ncbi:MAG: hypothetical protein ABR555_05195 [Pyrinomonadaceae bacterium]
MAKIEKDQSYTFPPDRCLKVLHDVLLDFGVRVEAFDTTSRIITGQFKAATSTTDSTERELPIRCACLPAGQDSTIVRLTYNNRGQLKKFVSPDVPTKMGSLFASLAQYLNEQPVTASGVQQDSPLELVEHERADEQPQPLAVYAAGLYKIGLSNPQIESKLMEKGLSALSVVEIMRDISKQRAGATKEAGTRNMLLGVLLCVGGIVVTGVTYAVAMGGGTFIVAWGAIIFGAGLFVRGLQQYQGKLGR